MLLLFVEGVHHGKSMTELYLAHVYGLNPKHDLAS